MKTTRRDLLRVAALGLLAAACAPAPSAAPTTAPAAAKPTDAPKPTTAPAASPSPAASPAASAAASPVASPAAAASPAASPAASTGASTAAAKPAANLTGNIQIGAVWSLTGGAAVYGPQQKNGADLAIGEINASGMLGSAKITLVTEDDRSVKEGAIPAFEKLIGQDKVIAILGPTLSNSAQAADPIAQDKKVVVMATSNTAGGILEIGNYIFRDSLPESIVVPNTVKVTSQALGYKKVAVMYGEDDAFTTSGYDVFKKALADAGIQTLTTETFKKGDTDFSAQLTKIKSLNPDAIILSALAEEAAGIMVQGRQLGIPNTVRFVGGNGLNTPQLAKLAGPAAEGAISGAAWFITADSPANQAFVKAYQAKYNNPPDQFAAQAYTGAYLLGYALRDAGKADSDSIRDALTKLKDVDTALGKFSVDPTTREAVHTPVVQEVKDGTFALFKA
jgi:branched-chain amino acid transport system substrate-binding protein